MSDVEAQAIREDVARYASILHIPEYATLLAINELGGSAQIYDIMNKTEMRRSTENKNLSRLELLGLIEKKTCIEKPKRKVYCQTPRGFAVIQELPEELKNEIKRIRFRN